MNTRIALYQLARTYKLSAPNIQTLFNDAGFNDEPAGLKHLFWRGAAVLAAALGGLGLVLWVAANWETLGRMGRFALLQGAVLTMGLGAATRPQLRVPLGLLALLCTGGLFAYFGQTYQTGADAWQLFALWAVLGAFLCIGARSDALWAPWAVVALTAISLWTYTHTGHRWRAEPQDFGVYAAAWAASLAVVACISPLLSRWTGAGPWAVRTAATLTVIGMTQAAVTALFHTPIAPHYPLALALFALAAAAFAQRKYFEIFILSATALGLNTLLVAGLVRYLFKDSGFDQIGNLLLIGIVAAGLLAASVSGIMRLARRNLVESK